MRISNDIDDHLDSLQTNEYIILPYESRGEIKGIWISSNWEFQMVLIII